MKTTLSRFFAIVVGLIFGVGCAGTSNPYGKVTNIATTNVVGTVITQQVGDQPVVTYRQENYAVTHTTKPVVPPVPNSGITGVTPVSVDGGGQQSAPPTTTSSQQAAPTTGTTASPQQAPSGGSFGYRRRRMSSVTPAPPTSGERQGLGAGLRDFFLSGLTVRSGTVVTGVRQVSGRVSVPPTQFERKALEHARQMDKNFDQRRNGFGPSVRVTTQTFTANVGGGVSVRSGLW